MIVAKYLFFWRERSSDNYAKRMIESFALV